MIEILSTPLDVQGVIQAAQSSQAGAVSVFIGTVRKQTSEKTVQRLEYEAYEKMAVKKMEEIVQQAKEKWNILNIGMQHRTGILEVGEIAVVIAVSTPHRQASFEACQYLIDTLKEVVPIWKKEVFQDGEVWVSAHA